MQMNLAFRALKTSRNLSANLYLKLTLFYLKVPRVTPIHEEAAKNEYFLNFLRMPFSFGTIACMDTECSGKLIDPALVNEQIGHDHETHKADSTSEETQERRSFV